jgi:hypothetical protein
MFILMKIHRSQGVIIAAQSHVIVHASEGRKFRKGSTLVLENFQLLF